MPDVRLVGAAAGAVVAVGSAVGGTVGRLAADKRLVGVARLLVRGRRNVKSRVARKESGGLQVNAEDLDRHDGPVLGAREVGRQPWQNRDEHREGIEGGSWSYTPAGGWGGRCRSSCPLRPCDPRPF